MLRSLSLACACAILVAAAPVSAAPTKKNPKLATCQFGAKEQKLTGAKRAAYMKRCMANEDSPRGPAPKPTPK
ncbi:MAG TPA: PsiF family protein [Pseudolabrys sp.]|nr:PsiF family protein [Pseudolabrys sp.]